MLRYSDDKSMKIKKTVTLIVISDLNTELTLHILPKSPIFSPLFIE